MILHVEKLLERAQSGEQLNSRERRHCLTHLLINNPEMSFAALSRLFRVSDTQIRKDHTKIRLEKSKLIQGDDVGLVLADVAFTFETQIRDLEIAKKKANPGSATYLKYCQTIFDLHLSKIKALQELGYYPKNLGNLVVERYEFRADVSKDGVVRSEAVAPGEERAPVEIEAAPVSTPMLDEIVGAAA